MGWEKIYSSKPLKTGDKYSERFTVGEKITDPYDLFVSEYSSYDGGGIVTNVTSIYSSQHRRPFAMLHLRRYAFATIMHWIEMGSLFKMIPNPTHKKNKKYFPQDPTKIDFTKTSS